MRSPGSSTTADETVSEGEAPQRRRPRSQFLPRIGLLTAIQLLGTFLAGTPALVLGAVAVPIYLAVVLLRTRDSLREPDLLHPIDARIFRYSGPGALLIPLTLLVVLATISAYDPEGRLFRSSAALLLIRICMETGLILSVACLCAGPELAHVRPIWLWKLISVPLMLVCGAYSFFLIFAPFAPGPK